MFEMSPWPLRFHPDLVRAARNCPHAVCVRPMSESRWYASCFIATSNACFGAVHASGPVRFDITCDGLACDGLGTNEARVHFPHGCQGAFVCVMDASAQKKKMFTPRGRCEHRRGTSSRNIVIPFVAPAYIFIMPEECPPRVPDESSSPQCPTSPHT